MKSGMASCGPPHGDGRGVDGRSSGPSGDIHDIGANPVGMMEAGFEVSTWASTRTPTFFAAIELHKPDILGSAVCSRRRCRT
jgi:hypothetical protein